MGFVGRRSLVIHLTLAGKRITVRSEYKHRDAIKALAAWPDVKWLPERKVWSIDARLYDKLAGACGADFAPLTMEFLAALPPPEAQCYGYFESVKRNAELEKKGRKRRERSI